MARARKKKWIGGALKKKRKGALHRYLGVPKGQKIPVALLRAEKRRIEKDLPFAFPAERKSHVKRLRQINFALNARKFRHTKRKKSFGRKPR